jgi:hypothetical protein
MTHISPAVADFIETRLHDFKEQFESRYEEMFVSKVGDDTLKQLSVQDPQNDCDATNKRFVESLLISQLFSFTCNSVEIERRTFFCPRFNNHINSKIVSVVFDTFPVKQKKSGEDVLNFMIKDEVQKLVLKKKSNEYSVRFDFDEPIFVEKNTAHTFFSDNKLKGSVTIWYTLEKPNSEID